MAVLDVALFLIIWLVEHFPFVKKTEIIDHLWNSINVDTVALISSVTKNLQFENRCKNQDGGS